MDSEPKVASMSVPDLPGLCRALADSSPLPTAVVDGACHIVRYVNPAFCHLLGKSPQELTGRAFREIAPAAPECLALLDRVYQTGEPETHTGEENSAAQLYWSYAMWPVAPAEAVAANHGRVGIVIQVAESGSFHDHAVAMNQALMLGSIRQHELTEVAERLNRQLHTEMDGRRHAEEALNKSEKLAAAGRMAATIAHEINNPREAVVNLCYLLRTEALNPHATALLQTLETELNRVAHITKQTLAFYREGKRPAEIDPSQSIDAVVKLFSPMAKAKGVKIEVDSKASPPVFALEGELRQVFSNLITNALDAGATILKIRVSPSRDESAHNSGRRDGVSILFADNGPGIPDYAASRLFEPFFTTKDKNGTGLGLWVSKGIVGKHEGWIQMRTSTVPGHRGTTFRVFLPAINAHSPPAA